ncbi:ABC transporter ATP-binding protein [Actinomycetota bacterium Odt1-20B]
MPEPALSGPRPCPRLPGATAAIRADGLVKRYKGMDVNAVDHLSFTVEQGAVVGLLGPNGAGKTTLTKLICGATSPTRGQVRVFGADPAARGGRAKRHIGVVHQSGPFDMMLPALDNLRIAASFKGLRWRDVRRTVHESLSAFGLDGKLSQLTFTLSGGEMRRLQVVRALLGDPPLLLLDEPSAGLDVAGRRQVWALLEELRRQHGTTVLWTSHYVEELERNCPRVLIVNRGRLVRYSTPRELAERYGGHAALLRPVDPHEARELADVLTAHHGTSRLRVTVTDGRVEVSGQDLRVRLPGLLRDATERGLDVGAVEYRAPSLEDAFLELVGVSEAGEAGEVGEAGQAGEMGEAGEIDEIDEAGEGGVEAVGTRGARGGGSA